MHKNDLFLILKKTLRTDGIAMLIKQRLIHRFIFPLIVFNILLACDPLPEQLTIEGNISLSDIANPSLELPATVYAFGTGRGLPVLSSDDGKYFLTLNDAWKEGDTAHIVFVSASGNYAFKTEYIIPDDIDSFSGEIYPGPDIVMTPVGQIKGTVSVSGELTTINNIADYLFSSAEGVIKTFNDKPINHFNLTIFSDRIVLDNVPEGNWPLIHVGIEDAPLEDNPIKVSYENILVQPSETTVLPVSEFNSGTPLLNDLVITSTAINGVTDTGLCSADERLCKFHPFQDDVRDIDMADFIYKQTQVSFRPVFLQNQTVTINNLNVISNEETVFTLDDNISEYDITLVLTSQISGKTHTYPYKIINEAESDSSKTSLIYGYSATSEIQGPFNYTGRSLNAENTIASHSVDYSVNNVTFRLEPDDQKMFLYYNNELLEKDESIYSLIFNIKEGNNTFNLKAISFSGLTETNYEINVFRGIFTDSSLKSLGFGVFATRVSFEPSITSYSISTTDESITSVDLYPLKQSPLASIQVLSKGREVSVNNFGVYPTDLTPGLNFVQIIVTAPDGITQTTYNIEIDISAFEGGDLAF